MTKGLLAAMMLLTLAGCGGLRTADTNRGEDSFLIVRERPLASRARTTFFMGRYDPATGTAGDYEWESPQPESDGSRWHLIRVAPGDYVILGLGILRGAMWAVCYGESTYAYRIGENEALYVGEIDPRPSLEDLMRQAPLESRDKTSPGSWVFVHENIRPPAVHREPDNAADLAAAQSALRARFPQSTFTVKWAEPTPAKFSSKSNQFMQMATCGA